MKSATQSTETQFNDSPQKQQFRRKTNVKEKSIQQFQPFPTEALPEPIRGFVVTAAKAIGCDMSYIALPLLSVLGSAIGNTRRLQLKGGWTVPAIIWTAIVGESGSMKTPAFKLVMKAIRDLQTKEFELHDEALKQYEHDLSQWEKDHSSWKNDKKTTEPSPTKPEPPACKRFFVNDTTVEALAPMLQSNPRGLLMSRDELAGWFGSFDKYTAGKADSAQWLSMFNGESITVDRKTGPRPTIHVPQASVSVTGGIQPTVLNRALGVEHRESGLAARILLTCPPPKPKRWTESEISPQDENEFANVIDRLFDLQPSPFESDDFSPIVIGLTDEAKEAYIAYYNSNSKEQANIDMTGDLKAAWSKFEEYAARLALVVHQAKWAVDAVESELMLDVSSMNAGIILAEWFKAETRRVYSLLSESDAEREQRNFIEWIESKGGTTTTREVQQGKKFETADEAELALNGLVDAGLGSWGEFTTGKPGRPTRRFMLNGQSSIYETPINPSEKDSFVTVDQTNNPETDANDWGEL